MSLLIIDNYDSFTYNLVQLFGELIGRDAIEVVRNDERSVDEIVAARPTHVIISPGPRGPADAGISVALVARLASRCPVLGVCLGHQCMLSAFQGVVRHAPRVMHGKTSAVRHDGRGIFAGVPNPFTAARYHSLIGEPSALPAGFVASAWSDTGELMGVRDESRRLEGVQFHPESFLTEHGRAMAHNFLSL